MDKIEKASDKYLMFSAKDRTCFLEYLVFRLSIAARVGYPEGDVAKDISLNYLKGVNEVLHVISQQILAHRNVEDKGYEENLLFKIAFEAFEMYAIPEEKMPMSFLDILYMAFRDVMQ